jgi:trimeric autotransporter adhesin
MKTNLILVLSSLLWAQIAGAAPHGRVVGWGRNAYGQATGTASPSDWGVMNTTTGLVTVAGHVLTDAVAIAAGRYHSLALRGDGTVVGWGWNQGGRAIGSAGGTVYSNGPVSVSGAFLSNAVSLAAGSSFSLALKNDGTVAAWGESWGGKVKQPVVLSNAIAIAAGARYVGSLILMRDSRVATIQADGSVRAGEYSNVVAVASSSGDLWPALLLQSNGTLIINADVPAATPPAGLRDVVEIAAGDYHFLALRNDGSVVGWGDNSAGQITGTASGWIRAGAASEADLAYAAPAGQRLSNVVAIASCGRASMALKKDGTVVTWGDAPPCPSDLNRVAAIAVGLGYCLAITEDPQNLPQEKH